VAIHVHREQPPAAQNNKVFAVQLANAAFVNTSALVVGDRLCGTSGRR
jgi:hypothetical protein